MEGLAAEAGVSKALPCTFFVNRDEVLVALYDRELAVLEARIKAAVAGVEGFVPRLTATVESWLDGVVSAGVLLGVLYTHPGLAGPVEERREESSRYLAESWGGAAAEEFGIDRRRAAERLIEVAIAGSLARWAVAAGRPRAAPGAGRRLRGVRGRRDPGGRDVAGGVIRAKPTAAS